jgi:hypothetical protein
MNFYGAAQAALRIRMIAQGVMHCAQVAQPVRGRKVIFAQYLFVHGSAFLQQLQSLRHVPLPLPQQTQTVAPPRRLHRIATLQFPFERAGFFYQPASFVQVAAVNGNRSRPVQTLYQ